MPDEKTPADLSDLEPLPDVEELEPLPEVEELEPMDELDPIEEKPAPAQASLTPAKPAEAKLEPAKPAKPADGGDPRTVKKKRPKQTAEDAEAASRAAAESLEALRAAQGENKAPEHLKKAAMIVAVACIVPWLATGGEWTVQIGSKALIYASAYLFHMCVLHRAGEKIDKTFAGLASKSFVDVNQKPKNAIQGILHSIPTPLHVLGWLFMITGLVLGAFIDPDGGLLGKELTGLAEVGMLAWAAGTFVHIDSFERGGKFNPIFPLMFLGHAIAGALTLVGNITGDAPDLLAIAGSAGVTAGGVFAMYTIVEAMKQAKVEGDLKKRAQTEARKAERLRKQQAEG